MGRHQAPDAAVQPARRTDPAPVDEATDGVHPPPPRRRDTPADQAGPRRAVSPPGGLASALAPRPGMQATTVLPDVPVGATRADLWPAAPTPAQPRPGQPIPAQPMAGLFTPAQPAAGQPTPGQPTPGQPAAAQPTGGRFSPGEPTPGEPAAVQFTSGHPTPVQPLPAQPGVDYSTGTFTRVLLTGLGGSEETAPPPPPPAPPTTTARAVAITRRLAARVAALRGDEKTALLAVAAVVGIVLVLFAILVLVVRLAAGRADPKPAAAPAPTPAASASASPSPTAEPSPTGSPLPPSGGSFASKRSGLCLAAPQGRADAGAQLVQRACGTDFGTGFLLVSTAQPGLYELVNAGASRCADVLGASMDNGAPVVQWDCNGGPNETFQLRPLLDPTGADSGYVQIVAAHSGKCLDVAGGATNDGAPVQQWDCQDPTTALDPAAGGNQSWRFTAD